MHVCSELNKDIDMNLTFDIDTLIHKSDYKLFRQVTKPGHCLHHLLPPKASTYTVLTSFVRGNTHTCFPPFNNRSLKTLRLIVVYLNMCNSLTITYVFS